MTFLVCFIALLLDTVLAGDVSWNSRLHESVLHAPRLRIQSSRRPYDAMNVARGKELVVPSVTTSRQLLQKQNKMCAWDEERSSCLFSGSTVFAILEQIDNPLSSYLQDVARCRLAEDEDMCVASDCQWYGSSCDISHEIFQDFASIDCLSGVRYLVDEEVGILECSALITEGDCKRAEQCVWMDSYAFCAFDKFRYHHGVPSLSGMPYSFAKIYDAREAQLVRDVEEAITNGTVRFWNDILEWQSPSFACPSGHKAIECDYVEAFSKAQKIDLYCRHTYTNTTSILSCSADSLCQPTGNPNVPCKVADNILFHASFAAEEVSARQINNSEAQKFEMKTIECLHVLEEDKCADDCTWIASASACFVNPTWIANEVYRLVGNSKDIVCQFFVSDVTSKCIEIKNNQNCSSNPLCMWDKRSNVCTAGLYSWLEIAVNNSALHGDVLLMQDFCFDSESDLQCMDALQNYNVGKEVLAAPAASPEAAFFDENLLLLDEFDESSDMMMLFQAEPKYFQRAMHGDAIGSLGLSIV